MTRDEIIEAIQDHCDDVGSLRAGLAADAILALPALTEGRRTMSCWANPPRKCVYPNCNCGVPLIPAASSSAPQVTDEVVERALREWYGQPYREDGFPLKYMADMRRVLEQFAAAAPPIATYNQSTQKEYNESFAASENSSPWPEWAERILAKLQEYGFDPVDNGEVDLAAAFEEWVDGYAQQFAASAPASPVRDDATCVASTGESETQPVGWRIGDRVEKWTGEARYTGVIVGVYATTKGGTRYVVEVKPQGFQMICTKAMLRDAP